MTAWMQGIIYYHPGRKVKYVSEALEYLESRLFKLLENNSLPRLMECVPSELNIVSTKYSMDVFCYIDSDVAWCSFLVGN